MINILEVIMIISTVMYSYLLIYCKRSGFIFGIVSSSIMGYILINSGVFVQAILHFMYVLMYIYSFFSWGRKNSPNISKITKKELIVSIMYILVFTLIMGYVFVYVGETHPYIDAFSAATSMTAVFLLSRKVIEHAYIFVLSNIASIALCYMSHDYITVLTFIVYMIFNIIRVYMWNKELVKQK